MPVRQRNKRNSRRRRWAPHQSSQLKLARQIRRDERQQKRKHKRREKQPHLPSSNRPDRYLWLSYNNHLNHILPDGSQRLESLDALFDALRARGRRTRVGVIVDIKHEEATIKQATEFAQTVTRRYPRVLLIAICPLGAGDLLLRAGFHFACGMREFHQFIDPIVEDGEVAGEESVA